MNTIKVTSVKALHDYVVTLGFSDGTSREINLEPYLHGEIFESVRNDMDLFRSVRIEPGCRTISWENGADIDPYTLYYGLVPTWSEEDDDLADLLAIRLARRENVGKPSIPLADVKRELGL